MASVQLHQTGGVQLSASHVELQFGKIELNKLITHLISLLSYSVPWLPPVTECAYYSQVILLISAS